MIRDILLLWDLDVNLLKIKLINKRVKFFSNDYYNMINYNVKYAMAANSSF
jgi:hypothetical protein